MPQVPRQFCWVDRNIQLTYRKFCFNRKKGTNIATRLASFDKFETKKTESHPMAS